MVLEGGGGGGGWCGLWVGVLTPICLVQTTHLS